MKRYALKRLLGMIPLLLGITIISFGMMHLAPGEPSVVGSEFNPKVSAQDIERLRTYYGLDQPLYVQYWHWLERLAALDFGQSFSSDARPVLEKISERIPVTLWINALAMLLIIVIAIPIGVLSAVHQNTWFDRGMTIFVFLAFAIPSFWLGLLLMISLGVNMQILPISGIHNYNWQSMNWLEQQLDMIKHLILPIGISAIGGLAGMSRFMRNGMLEVIRADYITTARAMGVPESTIRYKLALKNAVLPIVTLLGLSIPGLIGGSVIVEQLFSIPGMGLLFYEAVLSRDYPLVMGITVIGAILTLVGNLIADLSYALVDPRIRTGSA
ncbi:MAG: diguanylate cyclase [Zetaproteobacteria bacterium CG_4_9_14_3_um_filter_49_83]|nr:MAG: diguanylate cyclase [Zetaproteobacteria bacterium CG1_02_49_23]PIQ31007.1 MAG: diguanylate cyclase [Zetaproteobacteria bacterium CG17_big_fil_post_rev_8_21_14_2_50_50_13]PIV31689.1 MAG: diguanylate cyclase [Zetaproteobacteria bacterium CG02_land_8_20_14_3_00_50_9]PIY56892.1 MAG: diguanylate cyclase [Zetaproteobacteria bacterium CG_4_10_14_0_8_um_filter_49_80]PJA35852.1 MAG: diguanylate cyclase [Zetaproteobacteria bacterium CG_4_9_14_3_um_filter_49_83]